MSNNTSDDLRGIFLYAAHLLRLNDDGLVPGVHDTADLHTIGTLCVLVDGLTESGDNPYDMSLNALAVIAGALLAADAARIAVPHLVLQWRTTLADADRLHMVAQQ